MILTPTSELDAVNEILSAVGDSPVDTLENPSNVNVINAIRILKTINRQQQARQWPFNTYTDYILNPDYTTKKIRYIDNFLIITDGNGVTYQKRGDYLYNPDTQSDIFEKPLRVRLVVLLPWEDLPDPMRHYITAKAAADFQIRYLGDSVLSQALAQDEQEAWLALQEYDMIQGKYNALSNSALIPILWRGN